MCCVRHAVVEKSPDLPKPSTTLHRCRTSGSRNVNFRRASCKRVGDCKQLSQELLGFTGLIAQGDPDETAQDPENSSNIQPADTKKS